MVEWIVEELTRETIKTVVANRPGLARSLQEME